MTRVAVVTGAAGGIGAATCDLLEAEGWDVVAVDRVPLERDNAIVVDLSDSRAVADALSVLPRVNALVNNAAVQLFKALSDTTSDEWDRVQAVNCRGAFSCIQALLTQLTSTRGAVVNVGSVHAVATSKSISAYAASKGALLALTRAAAVELADLGIRVNAVLPGAVETPALRQGFERAGDPLEAERRLVAATPLGRIGEPSELAQAIAFLADSTKSGFVTGQYLVVDGGVLARLASE